MLTKEGRAYLFETKNLILRSYPKILGFFRDNAPFFVYFRFTMTELFNKGYPKTTKTRYKRVDVTNRVKLLEDALKDVAAVDDSQNVFVATHKVLGTSDVTDIFIWDLDQEKTPFDDILRL
jgi:hypothetical protein